MTLIIQKSTNVLPLLTANSLKNICPIKMLCPICQSPNAALLFSEAKDLEYGVAGKFDFKKCPHCQIIFLSPTPRTEELLSFYPGDYHGYGRPISKLTRFLIGKNLSSRANLYKRYIGQRANILDVGSADGCHFDFLSKKNDWRFCGIEFNGEIAQQGRSEGRNIQTSTIENCSYAPESFDLIIMNHLIEHVTDPKETIRSAARLLKKGGFIIGETPNSKSWDFTLTKKFWGGLHTPRHTFIFNPDSLEMVFRQNGFVLEEMNYPIDTSHWALSAQNFLQSQPALKIQLAKGRAFYYPALLMAFIPLNILQSFFKRTGIIQFIFKKT